MTLEEAKMSANEKKSYVGKKLSNGMFANAIIPFPNDITLDELKTYCEGYRTLNDIDKTVMLTQTENKVFYIGVIISNNSEKMEAPIGMAKFSTCFPVHSD